MRNLLLLLTGLFFILGGMHWLPSAEHKFVSFSQGEINGEWVQDTVADFAQGELSAVEITSAGNGEITLTKDGEGVYTSPVHSASINFTAFGLEWEGDTPSGTEILFSVRTSLDGNAWSDWMPFTEDDDVSQEDQVAVLGLVTGEEARYLQYRATMNSPQPSRVPTLERVRVFYINSAEGPTLAEAQARILPMDTGPGAPQPEIISRTGWGAREDLVTKVPEHETPLKIIVHHTVTPNFSQDPAAQVRAVFYYHTVTRGWGDIGYNYLIDWMGNVYEGRKGGEGVVGRHAIEYSRGSIGIALLGDFSQTEVPEAMKQSLINLIAWAADRWGIDPRGHSFFIDLDVPNVLGHRDVLQSGCPGDFGYRILPEVREAAWQKLLDSDPRLEFPLESEIFSGEVTLVAQSSSPTTESLKLFSDGEKVAEGVNEVNWTWDTTSLSDGEHTLRMVAHSVSGRKSEIERRVIVDNNPPQGELIIGSGNGFISSPQVTLIITDQDQGSGVEKMQFLAADGSPLGDWEDFSPEKEWTFPEGEGEKSLGVLFQDRLAYVSQPIIANVVLDQTPPSGWSPAVNVEGAGMWVEVSDALSGLDPDGAEYSLSDYGQLGGEWRPAQLLLEEDRVILAAPILSASGWIRFRAHDRAGNESISPPYPVPTPPPPVIEFPDMPDLVVETVLVEPQGSGGDGEINISGVIANQGGAAAEDVWVDLILDPQVEPTLQTEEMVEAQHIRWHIPEIAAGQTASITSGEATEGGSLLASLTPGTHTFYISVDPSDQGWPGGLILEGDEKNNLWGPGQIESNPKEIPSAGIEGLWERIVEFLQQLFSVFNQGGENG